MIDDVNGGGAGEGGDGGDAVAAAAAAAAAAGATGSAEGMGATGATGGTGATGATGAIGDGSALGGETGATGDPGAGIFPGDWREKLAGGDERRLTWLKRYGSLDAFVAGAEETLKKFRASGSRKPLGENPTAEELADYRKANGVPEALDGYGLDVPDGITLNDEDKVEIDYFRDAFHKLHIPEAVGKGLLGAYFARRMEGEQALRDAANEATVDARATMRAEYGRDYDRNLGIATNWLDTLVGESVRREIADLTLSNGLRLGNHPAFVRLAVQAGLAAGGDDPLVIVDNGGGGKSLDEQYREAMDLRYTDERAYNSPDHQARLMKLAAAVAKARG